MESTIPKGLIVLAIIWMLSSLSLIPVLLRSDAQMIFLGHIFSGLSFKAYYVGLSLTDVMIAVGLLYRRKLAYVSFIIISVWCTFIALVNICVTTNDTLLKTGWKQTENITTFRTLQGIAVILAVVMVFWLFSYRYQFRAQREKENC